MSYIQNKLDEFTNFQKENGIFIKYLGEETQLKFTMYDDFLFKALKDYHNHIVEKFKEKYKFSSSTTLFEILSILQDTNPKE